MGKRLKEIYPDSEVCHLFFNRPEGMDHARNRSSGRENLFFEGRTIYSYGRHYAICKLVNWKGQEWAILNGEDPRGYSRGWGNSAGTTIRGHNSMVYHAMPYALRERSVKVQCPTRFWIDERNEPSEGGWWGLESELRRREEALKEALKKCKLGRRVWYGEQVEDIRNEAVRFARVFDRPVKRFELPGDWQQIREKLKARSEHDRRNPRPAPRYAFGRPTYEYRQQLRRERDTEYQRIKALPWEERLEAWRNGEFGELVDPPVVATTSNPSEGYPHGGYPLYREFKVFLKILGGEVVTSKGARFPVEHAHRAARQLRVLKEMGRLPYQKQPDSGLTFRLGYYEIDRIEEDGTIWAGCHRVEWGEVEWFLQKMEEKETVDA